MIDAFRAPGDRRWYRLALGSLIVSAWGALAAWGASPYARLLHHESIGESLLPPLAALGVFTLGWTLMTIAMMLPSSLPLVNLFPATPTEPVQRWPLRAAYCGRCWTVQLADHVPSYKNSRHCAS